MVLLQRLDKIEGNMGQDTGGQHYRRLDGLSYGSALCRGAQQDLTLDLALPKGRSTPVPLVLWIHGGGFRGGDKGWAGHRTDARWLTRAGYAYASINYRLKAERADLSAPIRAGLDRLHPLRDTAFRRDLSGAAALAAMEDTLAALAWLCDHRAEYGISDWIALGGSSAGAITAFNVVHLTGFLGLSRPPIRGVVSISGGFAYPDLFTPGLAPFHALHNPQDSRVDIASIRGIAARGGDYATLVESPDQQHGRVRLSPDEPPREAYARITGFLDGLRDDRSG